MTADYSESEGFGVSLLVSANVGRDSRTGDWHSQARALAGSGALSGLAFLDINGNGRRDPGEPAIEGAGFLLNGGGNLARTDASGVAFLSNLPPYQDLDVGLSPSTLEDPYWKPAREGVKILPRPGKVVRVDFPVEVSGEITGTLSIRRNEVNRVAGNVELELVDPSGWVVQRVHRAYDGFYDLAEVKPGSYTLRVASGEINRLRLTTVPARQVRIAPSGTILEGVNFLFVDEGEGEPLTGARLPEPVSPAPLSPAPAPAVTLPPPPPPPAAGDSRLPRFATTEWSGPSTLYAVQIAAYRDRSSAERQARLLGEFLRSPTRVFAVDLGAKGIWFRVLAGELPTAAEALVYRRTLLAGRQVEVGPAYAVEARLPPR